MTKNKTELLVRVLALKFQHAITGKITHGIDIQLTHQEMKTCEDALLRVSELEKLLLRVDRLCKEALPRFNWGASALDANAIALLNEVPGEIASAVARRDR